MTARVVGALYLAGFVVGIGGDLLVKSRLAAPDPLAALAANSLPVALGAVLWLLAVAGDAAHGVLMFPVLRQHHERVAVGYLAARIMDALFIALMVVFILAQIPLGRAALGAAGSDLAALEALRLGSAAASQYAYSIGMTTLGVSGVLLCWTLYRARLIPRVLAVWGFAGYAIIACGMVSDILGSGLGLAASLPGGLWEVFIGGWLIAKGFSSPVAQTRLAPATGSADIGSAVP